ncbi:MAG: PEP-CTERM sorting domain-containing protein [bacterium]|nr:PEP-CTERM sorting domain-containing protein [bacterium]
MRSRLLMIALVAIALAGCAPTESPTIPDAPDPTSTQPPTTEPETPEVTVVETITTQPATTQPATTQPATTDPEAPKPAPEVVEFDFSFAIDADGWVVGFADLPENYDQSIYELDSGHRALPDGLDGSGIYLQGHNRSDDLFMYLKRRVEGLVSGASYTVFAAVDLATDAPLDSIGIGGSPGQSVYVKAGASTTEPDAAPDSTGHLRMDIDKGNQSRGGTQMSVLGVVGHPDIVGDEFRVKTLDSMDGRVVVEADEEGRAWLIVGTDSGFEGLTRLYYDRISFTLTPVEPA